ncbi:ClpXP adapter SpxH family protein [Polluticaenibacter yanchengensis]|uniref:ClpXP adapter SpxH family protein n=1 Tax=Polluticaenibacter yanchengensis TaxID=3014562 RepID=A0ABT4UJL6_9BACT|nr:ClpXP adapter SpxH family protein [Chitinophagaceae bacterium LY-5]
MNKASAWYKFAIIVIWLTAFYSCTAQVNDAQKNKIKMAKDSINNNPLICDPVEGICGIPDSTASQQVTSQQTGKPIKIVYFTDPICSSCWGIEPQLRKLKLEYGKHIEIDYRMGGLLPDWSYNSGGISKPSDVAHHWDEVSAYYDMPIDGDIWLEDPLASSYPPSIAFKAAQMQDKEKAILFLRKMRELLFLRKKNIAKWEHMAAAAKSAGLNPEQLKIDFEGKAKSLFEEDLKLAKEYGVRGFPTMIFMNSSNTREVVYGAKPYPFYETAIFKLYPQAGKSEYTKTWEALFAQYPSLTAKEFTELSGTPRAESEKYLDELTANGKLEKITTKNGAIWQLK